MNWTRCSSGGWRFFRWEGGDVCLISLNHQGSKALVSPRHFLPWAMGPRGEVKEVMTQLRSVIFATHWEIPNSICFSGLLMLSKLLARAPGLALAWGLPSSSWRWPWPCWSGTSSSCLAAPPSNLFNSTLRTAWPGSRGAFGPVSREEMWWCEDGLLLLNEIWLGNIQNEAIIGVSCSEEIYGCC